MIMVVDLSYLDDAFERVEAAQVGPVPDGRYQGYVDRACVEVLERTGVPYFRLEFVLVSGEFEGRRVFYGKAINEAGLPYLKKDLVTLGLGDVRLSELEGRLGELLDVVCDVQLRTGKPNSEGKQYQNVYVNRVVGERGSRGFGCAMDEDIPF